MYRKMWAFLAGCLLLGGTVIIARYVASTREKRSEGSLTRRAASPAQPDIEAKGIHELIVRERGHKVWLLRADKVKVGAEPSIVVVDGLREATYFRNDQPVMTLSASMLRLNRKTRNLALSGQIRVTTPQGLNLQTQTVFWSASKKQIWCPGKVVAVIGGMFFQTKGLRFYPERHRVECSSAVLVSWSNSELRADRLTLDIESQVADLAGNVFMKTHMATIAAPFSL